MNPSPNEAPLCDEGLNELRRLLAELRFTQDRADYRSGRHVEAYAHPWPAEGKPFDVLIRVSGLHENAGKASGLRIRLYGSAEEQVSSAVTNNQGQASFKCLQQGTYAAAVVENEDVEVADEMGLTLRLRSDPSLFFRKMEDVAPVMLERVELGRVLTPAFLVHLRKGDVLKRLQSAQHVRDEIGGVLADFCREGDLRPSPEADLFLTPNVMDNILYQVAVVVVAQAEDEEGKECSRQMLQSLQKELTRGANARPAEQSWRFAASEYAEGRDGARPVSARGKGKGKPDRAKDVSQRVVERIQHQFDLLAS